MAVPTTICLADALNEMQRHLLLAQYHACVPGSETDAQRHLNVLSAMNSVEKLILEIRRKCDELNAPAQPPPAEPNEFGRLPK